MSVKVKILCQLDKDKVFLSVPSRKIEADKILSEYLIEDMAESRDKSQYGNEKGLSVQHYLIKMLHQILISLDTNDQSKSFAVILNMIDWSQAFDRLSHRLGVQSFIDNGV